MHQASTLREEFLHLYERFVREVIAPLLDSPDLVYQAVPVFRVFMPYHLAVGPRHTDAGYHVQPNELNFWVALTSVHGTNTLQVESAPGAGDFEPVVAVRSHAHCRAIAIPAAPAVGGSASRLADRSSPRMSLSAHAAPRALTDGRPQEPCTAFEATRASTTPPST